MKHFLSVLAVGGLLNIFCIATPARAAVDLVTDVNAADALADLLTYAVDRTDASAAALQKYLSGIGKADAYAANPPAVARAKRMPFNSVFKAAVLFVQNDGEKFADPSLKDRDPSELLDELTELQSYNIQQFMHLNQQRDSCDSMRAYLKSIGEFDKFVAWAEQNAPDVMPAGGPATQPAADTPEQLAQRMASLVKYARSIAWRKAEARGVSEADFEKQWQEKVAKYRDGVADKVEGVRALGGSLAKSEIAGSNVPSQQIQPTQVPSRRLPLGRIPPPAIWTAPPPVQQKAPDLPPPVNSPDTDAHFRQLNDQNAWDPWTGQFYDHNIAIGN